MCCFPDCTQLASGNKMLHFKRSFRIGSNSAALNLSWLITQELSFNDSFLLMADMLGFQAAVSNTLFYPNFVLYYSLIHFPLAKSKGRQQNIWGGHINLAQYLHNLMVIFETGKVRFATVIFAEFLGLSFSRGRLSSEGLCTCFFLGPVCTTFELLKSLLKYTLMLLQKGCFRCWWPDLLSTDPLLYGLERSKTEGDKESNFYSETQISIREKAKDPKTAAIPSPSAQMAFVFS